MSPGQPFSPSDSPSARPTADDDLIADQAATWVARRDRGLTAQEARALAAWEAADPRHAAELAHFGRSWRDLADISALPAMAAEARALDTATLASFRHRRLAWWAGSLAAAAAIAFLATLFPRASRAPALATAHPAAPTAGGTFMEMPGASRSVALPDGTTVELNGESQIEADFTPTLRRVRLRRGEAHFIVAKSPDHPFIVSIDGLEVRAVGTAFNVRRGSAAVEVLVTEGKVRVEGHVGGAAVAASPVEAGQRAVVALPENTTPVASNPPPSVTAIVAVSPASPAEISDSLAWQGTRLVFDRLPLGKVVEIFNRHNRRQLTLADPTLASRRVSGIFRADNLDGFVRLMSDAFDIAADRPSDSEITLRQAR